ADAPGGGQRAANRPRRGPPARPRARGRATLARTGPLPARREPGERLVGEPGYGPLRERLGAELLVESDRRRIRVERRPLEPGAAPLDREAGQAPQQRRADPAAPVRLVDVEVLQVDAEPSSPGEVLVVE